MINWLSHDFPKPSTHVDCFGQIVDNIFAMIEQTDPSTWPEASYNHHPVDDIEPVEETDEIPVVTALCKVLDLISDEPNRSFAVDVLSVSLSYGASQGLSLAEVARRHGVTRAAAQKKSRYFRDRLRLPAAPGFKSEEIRRRHRERNRRNIVNE